MEDEHPTCFLLDDCTDLLDDCAEFGDHNYNRSGSLGFMELLNMHHEFGTLQEPLINAPPTPNSSSISSESMEPEDDKHHLQDKNNKHYLKAKKTSQLKRQREPRFAFMTKSEVDHLEDGYRWRKYGQKAVKNSAFPRSYYRCTSATCNVKKRVERCWNDPSVVVTTYEGQHTHPSPMTTIQRPTWHSTPVQMPISSTVDHGLLQDILPSSLIKDEKQHHHHLSS